MKKIINNILLKLIYWNVDLVIWDFDETFYFSKKCLKISRHVFLLLFIKNEINNTLVFSDLLNIFREKEKKQYWFEIVAESLKKTNHEVMCLAENIIKKENYINKNLNLTLFFAQSKKQHIILTNSSTEGTKKVLLKLGFKNFDDFLDIIGIDKSVSPKPSIQTLQDIFVKYSVRPEKCLMIGDSLRSDIEPAQKLGMKTILVKNEKKNLNLFCVESVNVLTKVLS